LSQEGVVLTGFSSIPKKSWYTSELILMVRFHCIYVPRQYIVDFWIKLYDLIVVGSTQKRNQCDEPTVTDKCVLQKIPQYYHQCHYQR